MSTSQNNISQFFPQKKISSQTLKHNKKSKNIKDKIIEEENDNEEFLKRFDLDPRFGPSIGLTRIERYENAYKFELNPPSNIPSIVQKTNSNICYFDR